MVARKSLKGDFCPSARALDVIGDWWSLLIVRDAFDGLTRFSEFQKSLGIAKNILAERLKTLVASGILELVPASEDAVRMQYRLTPMGKDLFPVIVALRQFGERHLFAPTETHSRLVDRATGQSVRLDVRAKDGRLIGLDEAVILKVPQAE